ncbi:hypothetical protein [Mycobacterium servetii]|uniref:Uncharacterized protein n=1 Tax=Mycobacterium servetii TaxID=3237418 RepID=A0ABV4BZC7_9MYCO
MLEVIDKGPRRHDMMLEPGWAGVAGRIHEWLQSVSEGPEGRRDDRPA